MIKAKNLEITTTSTFTGNISALNIYTKTDVDGLLAVKVSSSDIPTALADKQDKNTLTSSLTLSSITFTGTLSCNKVVARYFEPLTAGTFMNFNISSTAVMALTATLIRLMQPVQINQGCKIQNNLSLGSYSPSNPNLWIDTTSIQNGSITMSNE